MHAEHTRKCLATHVNQGIKDGPVVDVVDRLLFKRGSPLAKIKVDNGPEFIARALDHWAPINQFMLDCSRPGKPTYSAFMAPKPTEAPPSMAATRRMPDTHWFLSLDDARDKLEAWRRDFNETRPHTSLGFMTPAEFASSAGVNPRR
jgi:putative transposase